MSSEAMSHGNTPDFENDTVVSLTSRTRNTAEIIDFSQASTEVVTSMFLTELRHPSRSGLHGSELATYIKAELSGPDTDPKSLRSRLATAIADVDIFDADELFDHKLDHDPVFQELVTKLQRTKSQRIPTVEREATLSLTKLRAAQERDSTDDDTTWHNVIERLFT